MSDHLLSELMTEADEQSLPFPPPGPQLFQLLVTFE